MKAHSLSLILVSFANLVLADVMSPYLFYPFEDAQAFPLGPLVGSNQGLQLMTPEAIVTKDQQQLVASRYLDVSGSTVVVGKRFTGHGQTHMEIWVRPIAVSFKDGAEFIDYDGAAVALFQNGDGVAELHALHIAEDQKGFWVSTGIRLPVKDGAAEDWFRLNITQQWEMGTWDLAVNGTQVLQGIGRGAIADGKMFEVWLYGNGAQSFNSFDDLLISADPPRPLGKQAGFKAKTPLKPRFMVVEPRQESQSTNERWQAPSTHASIPRSDEGWSGAGAKH